MVQQSNTFQEPEKPKVEPKKVTMFLFGDDTNEKKI